MNNYLKYILVVFVCMFTSVSIMQAQRRPRNAPVTPETHGTPDFLNVRTMPDEAPPDVAPPPVFTQARREPDRMMGNGEQGIDVSHYQGRVNWNEVAQDRRITFVILKATEGNNFVDDTYRYNISECKRLGIPVGSYHFYRANVDADAQFDNMMRVINPNQQDILPVIDVELTNGVSTPLFLSRLEALCDLVTKAYGARPIIYTGRNFYAKYFNSPKWKNFKFWIAAYTSIQPVLTEDRDYMMWQYSDKGRVRGIRGDVDMNRFVLGHSLDDIRYKK